MTQVKPRLTFSTSTCKDRGCQGQEGKPGIFLSQEMAEGQARTQRRVGTVPSASPASRLRARPTAP